MTCPTELTLLLYSDGALTGDECAATELHVATCPACRARITSLHAEAGMLAVALAHDAAPDFVPPFAPPVSRRAVIAGAALTAVAAMLIAAARTLFGVSLPTPLTWFNPFDLVGGIDITVRLAIFLAQHGGAIMDSIVETAAAAVSLCLIVWLALSVRAGRVGQSLLVCLVCALVVLPSPSHALEIRHDQDGHILVAAEETIADTLIAAGETVEINGTVEGDLIAFGRRVIIHGRIGGQVITGASSISIDGDVAHSVLAVGQTVDLSPMRIGGNLYGFGEMVNTGAQATIEQNAIVFAERATFAGPVARDIVAFGEHVEVGSTVGGALTAYAQGITLLASARIGSDLRAHVPDADNISIAPGAVIGGELVTDIDQPTAHKSPYATGEYYLLQLLRFAAAFVTGVVLLVLVPALQRVSLTGASDVFRTSAIGLLALVATPIIAIIVAVTIIGIPVALVSLLLWLAGLYLAKVVLAQFIGTRLVEASGGTRHFAVAFAAGLALVILLVNLPFIGGLLNALLTICGLGMLVLFLWRAVPQQAER